MNNWNVNLKIKQNSVTSKLYICWTIEVKALKLAFSNTISENIYQEFQESLNKECDVLIQVRLAIN